MHVDGGRREAHLGAEHPIERDEREEAGDCWDIFLRKRRAAHVSKNCDAWRE